jgi:hypothetical protein
LRLVASGAVRIEGGVCRTSANTRADDRLIAPAVI